VPTTGAKKYADNEVDGSRSARTRQRNEQVHRKHGG
jgi:hypothetical protein